MLNTLVASKNPETGLTAYIDKTNGDAFLTDTLICSLFGIGNTPLAKIIASCSLINYAENYSEILTGVGLRSVISLRKSTDLKLILRAWKPTKKENQLRKEEILDLMIDAGATAYVYSLCGYTMQLAEAVEQKPKTRRELAEEQLKLIIELELKEEQIRLLEEATERQAEVIDELFDFSSIIRVAKYNSCSEKTFSWHLLKAASRTLKLEIKVAPCPRFGTKNLYSHDAWKLAYPEYKLPECAVLDIIPPAEIQKGGF